MNHLPACRVCLAHDTRLCSIMDSQFRDIYEKLVGESLDTEDMLPTTVCYICFAAMKKMLQFRDRSQKANQILRQMISSGLELSVSSLDMLVKNQTGLSWTLKISDIERTTTTSADDEVKVKIESAESEMDIDGMSDRNEAADLARTTMYPFPGGIPVPCPINVSPEMSQVAASWHTPSMDPISSAASGFQSRNTTSLTISSFSLSRSREKGSSSSASDKPAESSAANSMEQNKKPHIKKPLNAFMIYMKEMRAKVVEEYTLKESAAINRILGRQWHSLSREEQAKYYERASQEQQLHMQLYPGWSARDNYGYGSRKKKSKRDRTLGGNSLKKCRARYGYDQRDQWCEPCRRKKKCARYMKALAAATRGVTRLMAAPQLPCSDDEIKLEILSDASDDGGDADTPLNSSWLGGLGALSSLAAPAPAPPHGGAATLRTFRKSRN